MSNNTNSILIEIYAKQATNWHPKDKQRDESKDNQKFDS